jgi:hypothetical protein
MRLLATASLAVVLFANLGNVLTAHHSMAGYDDTQKITLRGTVSEYKWRRRQRKDRPVVRRTARH